MKFHIGHLWAVSFLIVLPLLAQKWVYSPLFFTTKNFKETAVQLVDQLNRQRYMEANAYFRSLLTQLSEQGISDEFAVVVITKKRFACNRNEFDCEPHYLQQMLAALDIERKRSSIDMIPVVVCSVDPDWKQHSDLNEIRNFFPIILRYNHTDGSDRKASSKEQETSDYAFCLEMASFRFRQTKYLIVVEDDAIVFENFFSNLRSIVKNRVEANIKRGEQVHPDNRWCWMKLYFPEFWSGFGWDANRLWELYWISIVGGLIGTISAFVAKTLKRRKVSTFWWTLNGSLYLLLLALVVSRPTWLEMRRIHVSFMQVTSESGCCSTVAVLYPMHEIPKIVDYLRSPNCYRCSYGVDLAIRDYKDISGMLGLLVQPNLAKHIGFHSTVSSAYKDPVQMLFNDLQWF